MQSQGSYSSIEFTASAEVLQRISELFEYIKQKKQEEIQIDGLENDLILMDFFQEQELSFFWWPTKEESAAFWGRYYQLPEEERDAYLLKMGGWDYETVFDEIGQGEYRIISCTQTEQGKGCLFYEPFAFPYGGVEPLLQALRAFGAEITRVSDWEGC